MLLIELISIFIILSIISITVSLFVCASTLSIRNINFLFFFFVPLQIRSRVSQRMRQRRNFQLCQLVSPLTCDAVCTFNF